MEILKASEKNIEAIVTLAKQTWFVTYSSLVPLDQITYMLDLFYKEEVLRQQMKDVKQHFLVLMDGDQLIGYSHCVELEESIKLSKLYFSPEMQGKGFGKMLMNAIEKEATELGYHQIELFVNRGNPAQYFYEKMGYEVVESLDMPLGKYWLNDYRMIKKL